MAQCGGAAHAERQRDALSLRALRSRRAHTPDSCGSSSGCKAPLRGIVHNIEHFFLLFWAAHANVWTR